MVAITLPRRQKEDSQINYALASDTRSNAKNLLDMSSSEVPNPKLIRRSSTFSKGLGLSSLTNSMSSFGRSKSSTASNPYSPATIPTSEPTQNLPSVLASNLHSSNIGSPDPSHLTQFSLRLSELINKAFIPCVVGSPAAASASATAVSPVKGPGSVHPLFHGIPKLQTITYDGKHLPDRTKVIEIAQTVVAELQYAELVDPYLLRAVSRAILKALTLFASRIDSLLVSPTRDPLALKVPTNAKEGINLSAAMEFNLGLISLEWIVEDTLERCIEGDRDANGDLIVDESGAAFAGMPHFVSEILTPVRQKMENTILHVVHPVLAQTKASLSRSISAAVPTPFVSPINLSPITTPGTNGLVVDLASTPVSGTSSPQPKVYETATPLHNAWLKDLEARFEGARRLLIPRIEERCGKDGEGWFISVAIHTIWKGLLVLTSRSVALAPSASASDNVAGRLVATAVERVMHQNLKPTANPAQLSSALKVVGKGASSKSKNRETSTNSPDCCQSPPSWTKDVTSISHVSPKLCALQLSEFRAFEKLMIGFCDGFLRKSSGSFKKKRSPFHFFTLSESTLNAPPVDLSAYDPDEEDELARAALNEAMHALRSTIIVLETMEKEPAAICSGFEQLKNLDTLSESSPAKVEALSSQAARALDAIPNLLLLQILYNRLPIRLGGLELPSPPAVFGYTWTDYEKAIGGFAGGEAWAEALSVRMKPKVESAWRSIFDRASEKISTLEAKRKHVAVGCKKAALADAATPLNKRNAAAPTSTLSQTAFQAGDISETESEVSTRSAVPEFMTRSAPTLERSADLHPSTDVQQPQSTRLSSPTGGDPRARSSESDLMGATTTTTRGRSESLETNDNLASASASGAETVNVADQTSNKQPSATPRFWRRSSSAGRGAFTLSFTGLSRSSLPKSHPVTLSNGSEPFLLEQQEKVTSSSSATAPPSPTKTYSNLSQPAFTATSSTSLSDLTAVSAVAVDSRINDEIEKTIQIVRDEAEFERSSLYLLIKAITYVGKGRVSLDLPSSA